MATAIDASDPREVLYPGWWVLAATFACAMLVIGSTNYAFQLFVLPVEQEFGLSRAVVNQGMSLFMIGGAVWAPVAGRLLDRFPAPIVMAAGGIALAIGLSVIASTSSLALIAAALAGPLALGAMCAGGLANTTVVSRWFRRRRGRALGIATVSSGAGGFVMVPLITHWIGRFGWRGALVGTGLLLAIGIALLALFLIRSRPTEEMLGRAGELEAGSSATLPAEQPWPLSSLLREKRFWLIAFGTGLLMASDGALLASNFPYLLELGIEAQAASFLFSCQMASSIAGKLGIGLAADRVDLRRLYAVVASCHVVLLLVLIAEPSYGVLLVALSLFGVGIGGTYPLLATLTATCFGSTSFGAVAGTMQLVLYPVSIALLTLIGAIHDRTGHYTLAFQIFIGIVFLAGGLIAKLDLEPRRPAPTTTVPNREALR